jgi:hypothetical protein
VAGSANGIEIGAEGRVVLSSGTGIGTDLGEEADRGDWVAETEWDLRDRARDSVARTSVVVVDATRVRCFGRRDLATGT